MAPITRSSKLRYRLVPALYTELRALSTLYYTSSKFTNTSIIHNKWDTIVNTVVIVFRTKFNLNLFFPKSFLNVTLSRIVSPVGPWQVFPV